ncbi:hypothetical protein V6590_10985 [Gemmobacter sp. JM10B15]|uniref:Ferrochelatase n=2 Tax=Gemmobacter denitrificans TaxID=3123040 RepID=A0ABU8BVE7_9RHOB
MLSRIQSSSKAMEIIMKKFAVIAAFAAMSTAAFAGGPTVVDTTEPTTPVVLAPASSGSLGGAGAVVAGVAAVAVVAAVAGSSSGSH